MKKNNTYFITGTAFAEKSTTVKLLAERHGGIACEENYHERFQSELDENEFPCLSFMRNPVAWHDFIRESFDEYKKWFDGAAREREILELRILKELAKQGKPIFVDTNISLEKLKTITPSERVLVMLAAQRTAADHFFDRQDSAKRFLYRLIAEEPDPRRAMDNYRQGLIHVNSRERHASYLLSGFPVLIRDDNRSVEQTLCLAERSFGLLKHRRS